MKRTGRVAVDDKTVSDVFFGGTDDGFLVFQPFFNEGKHGYVVQSTAFNKDIQILDAYSSMQFAWEAHERIYHFHPKPREWYIFISGKWQLEVAPMSDALAGQSQTVVIDAQSRARGIFVPPRTCHRLRGKGELWVLKAPPVPEVGLDAGKVTCNECLCNTVCGLRKKLLQ